MTRRGVSMASYEAIRRCDSRGLISAKSMRGCGQTACGETCEEGSRGNALHVPSNGEVEGPRRSARLEPRAHTVFPRPRRHYRLSRTPPTIVRAHARHWHTA